MSGELPVRLTETAEQRDRARTIFEKSQPGRRAFVAPELDVPKRDGLLVAITERRTREDIDRLAALVGELAGVAV